MRREEIERLLPEIFRRTDRPGGPLRALLEVMEELHEPDERVLGELDRHFDPNRCPDDRVPFLAGWVDLGWLLCEPGEPDAPTARPFPAGNARLRQLVVKASELSRWRGTNRGLLLFLSVATGMDGFSIEERPLDDQGQPRPFHIKVTAPEAAQPHRLLLERIIEHERPIFVTYDLEFREATGGGSRAES